MLLSILGKIKEITVNEEIDMHLTLFKPTANLDSSHELRQEYESSYLMQNQRFVGFLALAAGMLQLILLFPDLAHIKQASDKTLVLIIRMIISVSTLVFSGVCLRHAFKSFRFFSWTVSLLECAAIISFLIVFHLYEPPNYIIQAMGMIFLIMIIFFVPNQWIMMVSLTISGMFAFALSAWLKLGSSLPFNEFLAGLFYMSAVVGLCTIVSYTLDLRGFNEYVTKQELIRLNSIDPLTKACNRTKLTADFDLWSAYSRRYHQQLSLAMLDIDLFKSINDDYGHQKADQVLINFVSLLKEQLRKTDILARWGGDEFVILFLGIGPERAEEVLYRIRQHLHDKPIIESVYVTCSFGVTGLRPEADLDALIHEADELMYQAKKSGGDRICRSKEHETAGVG